MSKRVVSFLVAVAAIVSGHGRVSAELAEPGVSDKAPAPWSEPAPAEPVAYPVDEGPVQLGWKTFVSKKAVRLIAHAIRKGGRVIHKILKRLDDEAAEAFRRHSRKIADGLDEIAELPDLTVRIVKEKLFYFLTNELGLSGGTAQVIVEAIAAVLV